MLKTGAIGRLDDVTKSLQTQQRNSHWHMQDFVNGLTLPFFSKEPQCWRSRVSLTGSQVAITHGLNNCRNVTI